MIIICKEIRRRFTLRNARFLSLSLGSGDDLRMIKFARARSLKRNNGSLFSRLSRAEKYLTVRISRRDVDTASHVSFLRLRRGAEDKSTRARFVYERVLENANEHIRRKKKKEEGKKQ